MRLGLSLRLQAETLGTASTAHDLDEVLEDLSVWEGDDHAIPWLRSGQRLTGELSVDLSLGPDPNPSGRSLL